jgi:hypothetical protein
MPATMRMISVVDSKNAGVFYDFVHPPKGNNFEGWLSWSIGHFASSEVCCSF